MWLKSLSLLNFKSHETSDFVFSERVNCIVGKNGSGKTNVLDAIHYLSLCKSFFNGIDSQNIRYEQDFFMIKGLYEYDKDEMTVSCAFDSQKKKVFRKNKKTYKRLREHIGLIPLVMVSPNDILLIIDGSEKRRKFLDGILSQFNRVYLNDLIRYNKVLSQRNALLKQMSETGNQDRSLIQVLDEQLIEKGKAIYQERLNFIEGFKPVFNHFYTAISGKDEKINLHYRSQLNDKTFPDLLEASYRKDKIVEHTTAGIHKDDLLFQINDLPIKKFASQGQQKTFLLALRLAQAKFMEDQMQKKPVLLLDDIYDKLDRQRATFLLELLNKEAFGQLFITDTDKDRIPALLEKAGIANNIIEIKEQKETIENG